MHTLVASPLCGLCAQLHTPTLLCGGPTPDVTAPVLVGSLKVDLLAGRIRMKKEITFDGGTAEILSGDDDEDVELIAQVARVCQVVDALIDEQPEIPTLRIYVDGTSLVPHYRTRSRDQAWAICHVPSRV